MIFKALLYATKQKPYLYGMYSGFESRYGYHLTNDKNVFNQHNVLNGKIVAECDFEVEKIKYLCSCKDGNAYATDKSCLNLEELCKASCLSSDELDNYLGDKDGYAIHIKNLHIFDKPKELNEVYKIENIGGMLFTKPLTKAPQNMMRVSVNHWDYATYNPDDIRALISIQSQWMCLILNHIKDVEVRRVVLKEMMDK